MTRIQLLALLVLWACLGINVVQGDEASDRARAIDILVTTKPAVKVIQDFPPARTPAAVTSGTLPVLSHPSEGDAQAHTTTPLTAGILILSQEDALASPKFDVYHLTDDPSHCPPCKLADEYMLDDKVIALSHKVDLVVLKHQRPEPASWKKWLNDMKVKGFPTDVVFTQDHQRWTLLNGVADSPEDYVKRIEVAIEKLKKPVKAKTVKTGYPIRGGWWSHPGEIHSHLKSGEHRGKWSSDWVDSLSNREAESLHSDDHENRVKWSYVP